MKDMARRRFLSVEINKVKVTGPTRRRVSRTSEVASIQSDESCSTTSSPANSPTERNSPRNSICGSVSLSDLTDVIFPEGNDDAIWPSWRDRRCNSVSVIDSTDSQSLATDDETSHFHVRFFNKYGRKGSEDEEFKDATCITHVYKDSVIITDMLNHRVVMYERSGRPRRAFLLDEGCEPCAAVVTPRGYVATTLQRRKCVAVWSGKGDTVNEFGHDILECPSGLAVDARGRYIVSDEQTNKVHLFTPSGDLVRCLGEADAKCGDFKQPRYVCCSNSSRIVVSDSGNHCIKVFDSHGRFLFKFGKYGTKDGEFKFPYGVCVDQTDHIIVADYYNDRVSLFSADGTFMQHLLTSERGLKRPRSVSIRRAHNRKLFVTHGGSRSTEIIIFKLIPLHHGFTVHLNTDV